MFSEGPSFFLNRGMLHACLMTICGRYTLTDRINISHFIYRNFFKKLNFLDWPPTGGSSSAVFGARTRMLHR